MTFNVDKSLPVPIYHQIAEDLKSRITSGELKPGSRLPAEMDVAKSLGISPMTARQAYSKLVESGHLNRFHGRGTFVSSSFAEKSDPSFSKTGVDFGLLLFNLRLMLSEDSANIHMATFGSELLSGIESACAGRSLNLHILNTNGKSLRSSSNAVIAEQLAKRRMDGLLLAGTPLEKADIDFLVSTGIPIVSIDADYKRQEILPAMISDEDFINLAVERLAHKGIDKMLLATGPLCFSSAGGLIQRRGLRMREAFFAAIERRRRRSQCRHIECDQDISDCEQSLHEFFEPSSTYRPQAVICDGDITAIAAHKAISEFGLDVPILNFGDSKSSPNIFASKPIGNLAVAAVELLDRARKGLKTDGGVVVPVQQSSASRGKPATGGGKSGNA